MPIEIRELHIKAVIDGGGKKEGAAQGGSTPSAPQAQGPDINELADLVVEKVMEILKEKLER